jgi:hypothetical protein
MKLTTLLAAAAASLALSAGAANAVTYVFAGSWLIGEGPPAFPTAPAVLSGVETAALLFGGAASDYVISTIDSSVANINFMARVDGFGSAANFNPLVAQDFKADVGAAGYGQVGDFSAYVRDHAPAGVDIGRNYAFRVSGVVPEPATWGMMIVGFGATGLLLRRRRRPALVA